MSSYQFLLNTIFARKGLEWILTRSWRILLQLRYRMTFAWLSLQAYKLHKKGKSLEVMDPTLTSSADNEQVKMCIHIGLLCTQGDPQLRPNMGRVVILLAKKPGNLEEPTRPGVISSRYGGSRRPSSSARTSSDSYSRTFDSSLNTNTATASTSTQTSLRLDPRGKRPISE